MKNVNRDPRVVIELATAKVDIGVAICFKNKMADARTQKSKQEEHCNSKKTYVDGIWNQKSGKMSSRDDFLCGASWLKLAYHLQLNHDFRRELVRHLVLENLLRQWHCCGCSP